MRRRLLRLLLAAPLLAVALPAARPSGAAALTFARCPRTEGFRCTTLSVPEVRGSTPEGEVSLHVARRLAGAAPSKDAVIALAGGPGQAAMPLAEYFVKAISPALGSRDLIVFDQRGTGESSPLSCPALEPGGSSGVSTLGGLVQLCGNQIGAARNGYTTAESVQDIEAIRQALGYEKLVLYGTSYGTKVAEQYAQTYPGNVEALVLDSVVPPEGEEPFKVSTFEAIKRALAEICSKHACRHIAAHPLKDMATLARRLRKHALKGSVYNGAGKRRTASLREEGLFGVLLAGDLNPALRAMLPAAVHAALHRDPAALLRLDLLSEGLVPSLPRKRRPRQSPEEVDTPLLLDTTCEDTPYPWQRTNPPETRLSEALAALQALPSSSFYPFDAATAFDAGLTPGCAYWPYSTPAAGPSGALPDVPTLILSGAQDLRTPTSNARHLAKQLPGAQLLVVPYTGHSVLGSDFSGCAAVAVEAFFEGAQVLPCGPIPNLFTPTPSIPASLSRVRSVRSVGGRAGRTLMAVLETMVDLDRQVIGATLQEDRKLPSGSSFGGLRGGYAKITSKAVRLHRFSFVKGVEITGVFPVRKGRVGVATVRIAGGAAAHGRVRIGSSKVAGRLGGHRFNVDLSKVRIGRASAVAARAAGSAAQGLAGSARSLAGAAWSSPSGGWSSIAEGLTPPVAFPLGPLARQP